MSEAALNRPLVLAIDDATENLLLIDELLGDHCDIKVAPNGARGLKLAQGQPRPDLILLDVVMPGIDGFEVCRQLKASPQTRNIPVLFLTAQGDINKEKCGLELGAVDYITKPINPAILRARVQTQLTLKAAADFLHDRNAYLEQEVERRSAEALRRAEEARQMRDVTLVALATLAETRDNETGNHILRTQHYVRCLAEQLARHRRLGEHADADIIDGLFKAAPLHDIGKVGIPDHILLKPGKLTADEFEIMKRHAQLGSDALDTAQQRIGMRIPILDIAKEIALAHHEKWDGSGYPNGLAGEDIPLSARVMAIADVYDALISRRIYKPPFPHAQAVDIILQGRGQHFDPALVDAFSAVAGEFQDIATRYADAHCAAAA